MKTLKFTLLSVLLFCLLWMGAIFFGPFLISTATSHFSNGMVKLTRVEVTPKLKINAAAVDFVLPLAGGGNDLKGASRAVSIDWKIRGGFELIGAVGPSNLEGYGTLKSINFTIKPTSIFNWNETNIKLEFQKLAGADFEISRGVLSGKTHDTFKVIDNVEFISPKAFVEIGDASFQAEEIRASMDHHLLGQLLTLQDLEIDFSSKRLLSPKGTVESASANGQIKLSNGEATFELLVSDVHIDRYQVKVQTFAMSSTYLLRSGAFEGIGDFSASNIVSETPSLSIDNYSGSFKFSPLEISHDGTLNVSKLELKTDQYFMGQIENGILDINLHGRLLPSKIDLKGQGVLALKEVADFNASIFFETSLDEFDIFNCLAQSCAVSALEAKYNISASGSALTGNIKCGKVNCLDRPLLHVLQTDDTSKFFQAISTIGILSPLALPIAYLAISGGEVVGNGHLVNF